MDSLNNNTEKENKTMQSIEQFAKEGFLMMNAQDIENIGKELGLDEIARKAASGIVEAPALSEVVEAAPTRAMTQAIRRFEVPGTPVALAKYLKHFTRLWAIRFAQNAKAGKSVPKYHVATAMVEAKAQRYADEAIAEAASTTPPASQCEKLEAPIDCSPEAIQRVLESAMTDLGVRFTRHGKRLLWDAQCGHVVSPVQAYVTPLAVVMIGRIPLYVPENRRDAMIDAITRVNWALLVGGFELDLSDGELRMRSSMPIGEAVPNPTQLNSLLFSVYYALETYGMALVELICTSAEPGSVIERAIESAKHDNGNSQVQ